MKDPEAEFLARLNGPEPVYVYDRDAVIGLNPIRAAQGKRPLTGRETYEVRDGKPTGRVLGADGLPL